MVRFSGQNAMLKHISLSGWLIIQEFYLSLQQSIHHIRIENESKTHPCSPAHDGGRRADSESVEGCALQIKRSVYCV